MTHEYSCKWSGLDCSRGCECHENDESCSHFEEFMPDAPGWETDCPDPATDYGDLFPAVICPECGAAMVHVGLDGGELLEYECPDCEATCFLSMAEADKLMAER